MSQPHVMSYDCCQEELLSGWRLSSSVLGGVTQTLLPLTHDLKSQLHVLRAPQKGIPYYQVKPRPTAKNAVPSVPVPSLKIRSDTHCKRASADDRTGTLFWGMLRILCTKLSCIPLTTSLLPTGRALFENKQHTTYIISAASSSALHHPPNSLPHNQYTTHFCTYTHHTLPWGVCIASGRDTPTLLQLNEFCLKIRQRLLHLCGHDYMWSIICLFLQVKHKGYRWCSRHLHSSYCLFSWHRLHGTHLELQMRLSWDN